MAGGVRRTRRSSALKRTVLHRAPKRNCMPSRAARELVTRTRALGAAWHESVHGSGGLLARHGRPGRPAEHNAGEDVLAPPPRRAAGIPKFYRWISERYPLINQPVKVAGVPEMDNFYLDMNGIVHNCRRVPRGRGGPACRSPHGI